MSTTWTERVWREYRTDNLTRAHRDVMLTLATYQANGGAAWPSHQTLAERAGCCVRTVQAALRAARELGLVTWTERRVRAGWRWLRTSNVYRLLSPSGHVVPGERPLFRRRATTGKPCRGVEIEENKGAREAKERGLEAMIRAAATLPDLLKARRAAWAAQAASR